MQHIKIKHNKTFEMCYKCTVFDFCAVQPNCFNINPECDDGLQLARNVFSNSGSRQLVWYPGCHCSNEEDTCQWTRTYCDNGNKFITFF